MMLSLLIASEVLWEDLHPLEYEFEDIYHEFENNSHVLLLNDTNHRYQGVHVEV
jgi:hypothetical protein